MKLNFIQEIITLSNILEQSHNILSIMAGPIVYPFLVILFLGVTLTGFAIPTPEDEPANVTVCERRFTIKCGIEIGNSIFDGGEVSDNCCRDVVALGKLCHDIIVNKTLAVYHPSANKAQALAKSEQVWNECVAINASDAYKTKTVEACLKKFTSKCWIEVERSIYRGAVVSDTCCHDLFSWGKSCHDIIADRNHDVRHPGDNKAQALARSGQVWNRCAAISLSPASSPSHWET